MCVGYAQNYETLPHKTRIISQSRCLFVGIEGSKARQVENRTTQNRVRRDEKRIAQYGTLLTYLMPMIVNCIFILAHIELLAIWILVSSENQPLYIV